MSSCSTAWRGGDTAAGEELVARHWASISRFFRSKIGDDGADLISQTFLACVEARDRIEGDNVKAYLFAVARRRLADHFRQRARAPTLDFAAVVAGRSRHRPGDARRPTPAQRAVARRRSHGFPLDDQIALELAYFEGLSTREIAAVLEIPENTVRSRLSRARDKLREVLATLAIGRRSGARRLAARRVSDASLRGERLRGLELRGDAEQQFLATVGGGELDADWQPGARCDRAASSTRAGRSR